MQLNKIRGFATKPDLRLEYQPAQLMVATNVVTPALPVFGARARTTQNVCELFSRQFPPD